MAAATELGLEITELRLGLPGGDCATAHGGTTKATVEEQKKRSYSDISTTSTDDEVDSSTGGGACQQQQVKKSPQLLVGWPPVCSYRRRNNSIGSENEDDLSNSSNTKAASTPERKEELLKIVSKGRPYVKVSADGIPFLRKVDLAVHIGYADLIAAMEDLFGLSGIVEKQGVMDSARNSEYVPIFEDKDGDWMLLGDVPWDMFVESCKRLRIMKS